MREGSAITWVSVGVTAGSAIFGALSGKKGAKKREQAIQGGISATNIGFDQADEFIAPRFQQEQSAMEAVNRLLGLGGEAPDFSQFRDSPGFQFQLDQGQQAIERSAAARGGLQSGNTLAAVTQFGQGLADTTFRNYLADVMALQSQGADAARANLATGRASNISNLLAGAGEARASGIETGANSLIAGAGAINDILGERRGRLTGP